MTRRLYLCVLPACGLHVGFPEVRAAGTPVGASGDGCPRLPARATDIVVGRASTREGEEVGGTTGTATTATRVASRPTTFAHYPDSAIVKRNQLVDAAVALFPNLLPEENAS